MSVGQRAANPIAALSVADLLLASQFPHSRRTTTPQAAVIGNEAATNHH
jgi:hypothetical protein